MVNNNLIGAGQDIRPVVQRVSLNEKTLFLSGTELEAPTGTLLSTSSSAAVETHLTIPTTRSSRVLSFSGKDIGSPIKLSSFEAEPATPRVSVEEFKEYPDEKRSGPVTLKDYIVKLSSTK